MSNEMKDWMADNLLERGDPYNGEETNYEKIISMSVEDMADFLNGLCFDDAPWFDWFDKGYCQNCDAVEKGDHIYSRCELEDENYPCKCGTLYRDTFEIVKAWLQAANR